jgi:hypothetical protein
MLLLVPLRCLGGALTYRRRSGVPSATADRPRPAPDYATSLDQVLAWSLQGDMGYRQ